MVCNKKTNEYAQILGTEYEGLYRDMPKAVMAAIMVSFASNGGADLEGASARIAKEWEILHANGIIPQRPSKLAREINANQGGDDEG